MDNQLEYWIKRNTATPNVWKNLDDLHVQSRPKANWIPEGVIWYEQVKDFLRTNNLPFYCELKIPLQYTSKATGMVYEEAGDLINDLSSTPPSLYLFPLDYENRDRIIQNSIPIFSLPGCSGKSYYKEYYDESEDGYYRSVFVL